MSLMQHLPERQNRILHLLQTQGHVSVSDLSDRLEVSEVTIRKDLRALEERELLYRTHGGAHLRNPYVTDRPLQEKAAIQAEEKRQIGEAAADLVSDRDSIIIGSGTTMTHLARSLRSKSALTVVTGALNVALELVHLAEAEVLLLGGMLRSSSASVVGPHAEAMLRDTACDKLFLGVDGFDLDFGLTTSNALEAALNHAMIESVQRVIVLADSSKFGRRGFRRICGIEEVDRVITDGDVEDAAVKELEERGVEVDVV
jgi:DeoR family transcriptional regulator of aga operon